MAFTDKIKKEVRQKAAYQCCICRSIGVEVHHIIPLEHDGTDDIDNASPLCPSCHANFGDNPEKRKVIKEMRDWWYAVVEKMYGKKSVDLELLKEINEKVEAIQKNQIEEKQKKQTDLNELKILLKDLVVKHIDRITSETAVNSSSTLINTINPLEKTYGNIYCKKCNASLGSSLLGTHCPYCGTSRY
jgi:5-methylcytosine-specific restriction endonuclease McrA